MKEFKMDRPRIPNEKKTIPCENPDCGRKNRPLYAWFDTDGTHSILVCDICTIKAEQNAASKF